MILNARDKARIVNVRSLGPPGTPMPPDCVYIGRKVRRGGYDLPESIWANPFQSPRAGTRDEVIEKYRAWIVTQPWLLVALPELAGKRLVCWCALLPCHGEVLLELLCDK